MGGAFQPKGLASNIWILRQRVGSAILKTCRPLAGLSLHIDSGVQDLLDSQDQLLVSDANPAYLLDLDASPGLTPRFG